jgi:DNA-binding NarL/FixJ family response regulator
MRILLAEDSALLREGLVALLERAGHEVVAAVPTATELEAEASARIPDGTVDLLLTDVRMPPGNGDDGLRVALAVREQHPQVPVVVLSQYVEHRYAARLLGLTPGGTALAGGDDSTAAGTGYLLKDRVSRVHDFLRALETVHAGGIVVDPAVVSALMEQERTTLDLLSPREREVLALVSEGETNAQIGARLHLSQGAVVKHVSAVFDKLGISQQDGNHRVLAVLAHLRGTGG